MKELPKSIKGKIVDFEPIRVDNEARQRFPCLRHLPLYCSVIFVEIDLNTLDFVSKTVLNRFKDEIRKRKEKRKARIRSQKKETEKKRESDMLEELTVLERKAYYASLQDEKEKISRDLQTGPCLGDLTLRDHDDNDTVNDMNSSQNKHNSNAVSFFEAVSEGNFPTLSDSHSISADTNNTSASTKTSAWGQKESPIISKKKIESSGTSKAKGKKKKIVLNTSFF